MKSFIKKFFDKSLLLFLIIGACNTVLSLALQFALFNWAHFGYWGSSATAFAICSISSFYFNKKYSFKNTEKVWITALRFALVIAVCYVLAYYVAQPLTSWLLNALGWTLNPRSPTRLPCWSAK